MVLPSLLLQIYVGLSGFASGALSPRPVGPGGGGATYAGARASRLVSLEVSYTNAFTAASELCDFLVSGRTCTDPAYFFIGFISADAKLDLLPGRSWSPFFDGGITYGWVAKAHYGRDRGGLGFNLGAGVDYWVSPALTVGGRWLVRAPAIEPLSGDVADRELWFFTTAEANLAYHF